MPAQQESWIATAYLQSGTISTGYVACLNAAGTKYLPATLANRTAAGRPAACIALSPADADGNGGSGFEAQYVGVVPPSITGLGTGTATHVNVSDAGVLARTDTLDATVVGRCDADGTAYVCFPLAGWAFDEVASTVSAGDGIRVTSAGTAYTVHGVRGTCSLEQFGAVGDGATNDYAALKLAEAALAAGTYHTLVLGARTYLCNGVGPLLTLPVGCAVVGQGQGVSVLKTTSDVAVIQNNSEDTECTAFSIEGNSTGTSQRGICAGDPAVAGSGPSRFSTNRVTFKNLGADGFRYVQNPLVSGAVTYKGPTLMGCVADGCGTGYRFEQRGEYVLMVGCEAQRCGLSTSGWGVYMAAGNVAMVGGQLTFNQNGVRITDDVNGGHAHFAGVQINHNVNQAIVVDCSNSYVFDGVTVYGADNNTIELTSTARGGLFLNSRIVIKNWKFAAGVTGEAVDCLFTDEYAAITYIDQQDSSSFRFVRPKSLTTGSVRSSIADTLVQTFAFAADANETLKARVAVAEELIVSAGTITATRTITSTLPPTKGNRVWISNSNAQTVNFAWSSGTSVAIPAGLRACVGADGTNARLLVEETSAGSGEANTMSSSGAGASIVQTKSGVNLPVRSFIGSSPIGVTQNTNDLTFAMTGGTNGTFLTWQSGAAAWGNLANYVGLGSGTLATAGLVRCQSAVSQIVVAGGKTLVASSTTEAFYGCDSAYGNQAPTGRFYFFTDAYFGIGSTTYIQLISDIINTVKPVHMSSTIGGNATASNPFTFRDALIDLTGVTTHTATAAEYSCPRLYVTRGTGTTCEVVLPNGPPGVAFLVTVDTAITGLEVLFTHIHSGAGATVSAVMGTRWVAFDTLKGQYVVAS
jgi:hypothetical protein